MSTLQHQALLYSSQDEFVDAALPFVRKGVEAGEAVLLAVRERNVAALREELGRGAGEGDVRLLSVAEWYENPARTRAKFGAWVSRRAGADHVRLIGEPPWPLGSEAGVREWARHEAVINIAMADLPLTFLCPYNTSELPDEVLEHAIRTHPEVVEGGEERPSQAYDDPHQFCRKHAGSELGHLGAPSAELEIRRTRLNELRRLVELEGRVAGLGRERLKNLIVAVNEVATNALVHGARPARLRIWQDRSELVCEVTDAGGGMSDPLAGQLQPSGDSPGGFGLWITRMTADATEIISGADGTTVNIHTALAG